MSTIKAVKTQEGAKNAHVLVTHVDSNAETPTEHSSANATDEQKPDDFVYSHGLDDQGMRVTAPFNQGYMLVPRVQSLRDGLNNYVSRRKT